MAAPSDETPASWVTLARIVKTQGRLGGLAADLLTDIPGRFAGLDRIWLLARSGERRPFAMRRHWMHQQRVVLELEGIDDLNAASAWIGAEVQVPAGERAPVPQGAYFVSDLEGCQVFDRGRALGPIAAVEAVPGAAALLHVAAASGELLIPFAAEYVESVSLAERRLYLRLPEGLLEINQPYAGVAPIAPWAKSARRDRETPKGGPPPTIEEARPRPGWGSGAPGPVERKRVARRSRAGARAKQ
jgi:16S rRNA processing protein RimM